MNVPAEIGRLHLSETRRRMGPAVEGACDDTAGFGTLRGVWIGDATVIGVEGAGTGEIEVGERGLRRVGVVKIGSDIPVGRGGAGGEATVTGKLTMEWLGRTGNT